ncbi:MAG: ParB N-terminal domain-containing protein [Candidatus Saccharicenans sp.]|nr:MAG: hypothetical protein C0168_06360 [Candidatus Aminicenantes bacterium]HEK85104.1 hypothetical protein [Candidatus Aminicenantes bacterium]
MKLRIIKKEEINLQDKRFLFTLKKPSEKLIRTIKEVGLVEPIQVIKRGGHFTVVSGWKRLAAALVSGLGKLPVLELPESLSDRQVLKMVFLTVCSAGQLSLAEKSLLIRRFSELGLKPAKIITEIMPWLELPPDRPTFELLLRLSKNEEILEEIHTRDWKLGTAEIFLNFSDEERKEILNLISGISHSQQKEIIEWLYILKKRLKKDVAAILAEPEISCLLNLPDKRSLKVADQLISILKKKVSPLVEQIGEQVKKEIKKMNLPPQVKVNFDSTLERPDLKVSFEVSSKEELQKIISGLNLSLTEESWELIFTLLRGKKSEEI